MDDIKIGSNRSFGIVFFVVFLIIAFYPLINDENIINLPIEKFKGGINRLINFVEKRKRRRVLQEERPVSFFVGFESSKIYVLLRHENFGSTRPPFNFQRAYGQRAISTLSFVRIPRPYEIIALNYFDTETSSILSWGALNTTARRRGHHQSYKYS